MTRPHGPSAALDRYYILAPSGALDRPKRVLKRQDAFLVADERGDFPGILESEFGLYVAGTRFLRQLELRLYDEPPSLLDSAVSTDNIELAVHLTNPDIPLGEGLVLVGRTVRVERRVVLEGDRMTQLVRLESFAPTDHDLELTWAFWSDFADVFEVRGTTRPGRGVIAPPSPAGAVVRLGYTGLDGITRTTHVAFAPPPSRLEGDRAHYRVRLPAAGRLELAVTVTATTDPGPARAARPLTEVVTGRRAGDGPGGRRATRLRTDNPLVNAWLERAAADLDMLATETPEGRIAYAGIPWYVAPFGRDSAITALQMLSVDPDLARGTLRFLARWQGTRTDDFTDQEPGKILHEHRQGEMANCREIPFIPYYGSVDATPLFCMLLAEYRRFTDDQALVRELWPALTRAVGWITGQGPYLAYVCRSPRGLVHQGWKDSHDAVMHDSGKPAAPPITLVEAQAYRHAALAGAAEIAESLGQAGPAAAWRSEAAGLAERFEHDFWMDDVEFYALALDGDGAPCRVISSNPGHVLWSGLASPVRAAAIGRRLMRDDVFSGWGIRTLAAGQPCYNPMSYHNGSVWPHDTAIAAAGLRRYGLTEAFSRLATGLFDAVAALDGMRMPELFCGFPRGGASSPIRYPVACTPQAWAAGTVFQLVAAMLGLTPDAPARRLTLHHPVLPSWIGWIDVRGLKVGDARVSLVVARAGEDARLEDVEVEGDLKVDVTS